jgi:hypothetical protein
MTSAGKRLGKHVLAAADTHATEERRYLGGPCRGVIRKKIGETKSVLYSSLLGKGAIGREPPFREDLSPEAEE